MKKAQTTTIAIVLILLVLVVSFITIFLVVYPNISGEATKDNKNIDEIETVNIIKTQETPKEETQNVGNQPEINEDEEINMAMNFYFSCIKKCPENSGSVDENCENQCMAFTTTKYPTFASALEKTTYFSEMGQYLSNNNMVIYSCLSSCRLDYPCSQKCLNNI